MNKKLTLEELAEAYFTSKELNDKEKEEADKQINDFRKKITNQMQPQEKLYFDLMGLKYRMQEYVNEENAKDNGVGYFLKEYLYIIKTSQKDFAQQIDLHPTKLSRIINGREQAALAIFYRLEAHSGNTIPAILWWRVLNKNLEQDILNDTYTRSIEITKVSNPLKF